MGTGRTDTISSRRVLLAVVMVAVAVGTVLLVSPWTLIAVVVAGCLFVVSYRAAEYELADAALLFGLVGAVLALPIGVAWPISPAIALVIYAVGTRGQAHLGPRQWCRRGRRDHRATVLAIASVPITTVALVAFIVSHWAYVQRTTDTLRGLPWWLIVLAGVGFALVNPTVEESLFRGVLQPAITSLSGSVTAGVIAQAIGFGAIHLHGIPGGPLGMVMAATWGAVLGYIRYRTGGMLLVWVTHVAANATIYTTLVALAHRHGLL